MPSSLTQQLSFLSHLCDADMRDCLEEMVISVGAYVAAVTTMETKALNLYGREQQELRDAVTEADRTRTSAHNALIANVDIVNRICEMCGQPPIYTGGSARREYGDFAFALVKEIFEARQ